MHEPGHGKAITCERDGRFDCLRPRDRPVSHQGFVQPRHRAWNAHRLVTHIVHPALEHVAVAVRSLAEEAVLPHVFADERARRRVELEERISVPWTVHEHHAAAAEAAHLGVEDALDEGASDGGVDGIAPAPHDLEPDLGRDRLRADDDGH